MANHGAIDVAMRWQFTIRALFRLVRTVRLHFNCQRHVVGHKRRVFIVLPSRGTGEAIASAVYNATAAFMERIYHALPGP